MSEPLSPRPGGGPMPRPDGNGLPPRIGGEGPGADRLQDGDSRDPGMGGEGGDIGADTGGMDGES